MKKILLLSLCVFSLTSFSQTVIFSCDFEDENLTGWLTEDIDGDENNWELILSSDQAEAQGWGPNMTIMLGSFGLILDPEENLTPNNVIATSEIEMPMNGTIQLDFKIGTNVAFANNHNFELYVVEEYNGFDSVNWTPFHAMNFNGVDTAQNVSLDLTEFVGKTVRLVFRHYNSKGQFVLLLDDIVVSHKEGASVNSLDEAFDFAIYPNPAKNMVKVETNEEITQLDVLNTQGKVIKTSFNKNFIAIENLDKGFYLLRVHTNSGFSSKVFLKE